MKNQFLFSAMAILFSLTVFSCKSSKPIQSVNKGSNEVILPFTEAKYKTDKDYFRAKNNGNSQDLATAKKIALLNAKTEIASNINSLIKAVTEQYTNQRSVSDKKEFESKFEETARNVVSQNLSEIRVMEEKVFQETNGNYSYWVVIEMPKTALVQKLHQNISQDKKLQLDYDKQKFEETFNAEMDKLAKQQQ